MHQPTLLAAVPERTLDPPHPQLAARPGEQLRLVGLHGAQPTVTQPRQFDPFDPFDPFDQFDEFDQFKHIQNGERVTLVGW